MRSCSGLRGLCQAGSSSRQPLPHVPQKHQNFGLLIGVCTGGLTTGPGQIGVMPLSFAAAGLSGYVPLWTIGLALLYDNLVDDVHLCRDRVFFMTTLDI